MLALQRLARPPRLSERIVEDAVQVTTGEPLLEGVPRLGEALLEQHQRKALPMHDRPFGRGRPSGIEGCVGLFELAQVQQADGAVQVRRPALLAQSQHPVGPDQRLLEPLGPAQQLAAVAERREEGRVERHRSFVGAQGRDQSGLLALEHTQVEPGLGVGGIERHRPLHQGKRHRHVALVGADALQQVGPRVSRREREEPPEPLPRLLRPSGPIGGEGLVIEGAAAGLANGTVPSSPTRSRRRTASDRAVAPARARSP